MASFEKINTEPVPPPPTIALHLTAAEAKALRMAIWYADRKAKGLTPSTPIPAQIELWDGVYATLYEATTGCRQTLNEAT